MFKKRSSRESRKTVSSTTVRPEVLQQLYHMHASAVIEITITTLDYITKNGKPFQIEAVTT